MRDELSLSRILYPVSNIGYLYKHNGKDFLDAPLVKHRCNKLRVTAITKIQL